MGSSIFYVYSDVIFIPTHVISWLHRDRLLPIAMYYAEFVRAELPNCVATNTDFFNCLEFWPMGVVDISFQRAATGKCATPTSHLIRQFDYIAATYELFPLAETKTIVHLLV